MKLQDTLTNTALTTGGFGIVTDDATTQKVTIIITLIQAVIKLIQIFKRKKQNEKTEQ